MSVHALGKADGHATSAFDFSSLDSKLSQADVKAHLEQEPAG